MNSPCLFGPRRVKGEKSLSFDTFIPCPLCTPSICPDFLSELQEQHLSLCFFPGSPHLTILVFSQDTWLRYFSLFKNHNDSFHFYGSLQLSKPFFPHEPFNGTLTMARSLGAQLLISPLYRWKYSYIGRGSDFLRKYKKYKVS